jgi:hypothetical protein
MNIFQDESGCLGFNAGSSKFFVVSILCPENSKHLANVVRKFKGDLIKEGWPRDIEIKAHNLYTATTNPCIPVNYRYKNDPIIPIFTFLKHLAGMQIEIDAIVVNKQAINLDLRTLPYGILFNYFSSQILTDRICRYDDVNLFVDETSKQTHDKMRFDGYISTNAKMTKGKDFNLKIDHVNSNVVNGVSAVDYVSWSLFRSYEHGDNRFEKCIQPKIIIFKKYFFSK